LNILNSLDDESAADTLEEVSPERQVSLLEGMDSQRAAEILDESKMFKINVIGTQNLVNASTGIIKHWVQLSSTGVYGKIKSVYAVTGTSSFCVVVTWVLSACASASRMRQSVCWREM